MSNVLYSTIRERLEKRGAVHTLTSESRIVIISDLHMGNGSKNDDFVPHADLFMKVLGEYYYRKGYTLVLNGDVEELQKNSIEGIHRQWHEIYNLFSGFHEEKRLYKIAGNHDSKLLSISLDKLKYPLIDALRLNYKDDEILIFHGHQFSMAYESFNEILGFFLRYVAKTLQIKNKSAAHNSRRRWKIEKRAYDFSRQSKILSILGHTHRPLFESLSKVDSLIHEIEKGCRQYVDQGESSGGDVEARIMALKRELIRIQTEKAKEAFISQIYSKGLVIPCLFNAGCVIGKRGMTAIEINGDEISLVLWKTRSGDQGSDNSKEIRSINKDRVPLAEFPGIKRRVIKRDDLRYIFTRINLLG